MNAVDTNILLYSVDQHEPAKQNKAKQLLNQLRASPHKTFLLWQVVGELVGQLRRWRDQQKLTDVEFTQHVQILRNLFPILLPTTRTLDHAIDLESRLSLSHWDSMLLGACRDAGLTTLYTEDMGAPTNIDGIQLINPLI